MEFLTAGSVLGLTAGLSPGPLFALVVAESLRTTSFDGIKVAVSPLFTDAPIIALCYFLLRQVHDLPLILGMISCVGAVYVFYLGISSIRSRPSMPLTLSPTRSRALWKGILTNISSPHPYLFWISVGTPLMIRASETGKLNVIMFLLGFYGCLIGAKITLAVVTGQSKRFLSPRAILWLNRVTGGVLILFSFLLLREGVHFFLE